MKAEDGPRVDLRVRTKDFALRIVKLFAALPKSGGAQILGRQVLRSGTSVGAQYREAHRAKSAADFINKIEGSLQELEETVYWLEPIGEADIVSTKRLEPLCHEADELISILVAITKKVKAKHSTRKR